MDDCLFCAIAEGTIPATVVHETDRFVAFRDISPQAPVHVVVIPREHHPDVVSLAMSDPELAGELLSAAADVAMSEGIAGDGFRVVLNTGDDGGQSVFHVHAHVLGGRPMAWPPG